MTHGNNSKAAKKGRTFSQRKSDSGDEHNGMVTTDEIRNIVKTAVEDAMKDQLTCIENSLTASLQDIVSSLRSELDIISGENDVMKRNIDILKTKIEKQEQKLDEAEKNGNLYRSMWQQSMTWCNNVEQYGRRWSLRIHGHKMANRNENCKAEVVAIIKSRLNINDISEADIDAAHRIGRPRNDKPRAIIVKFFRRDDKQRVIGARRKLKHSDYVITEDLTELSQKLLNRARIHSDVSATWSWNGNIWCITHSGHKIKLNPYDNINETIANQTKTAQSVNRISSARPTKLPQTGTRQFGASPTRPTDNNMIPAQTLLSGSKSKAVSTDDNITTTTVSTSTPTSGSSSDKNVKLNRDVNFVTTNSSSVVPAAPATVNNMNTTIDEELLGATGGEP